MKVLTDRIKITNIKLRDIGGRDSEGSFYHLTLCLMLFM